jgi:hypothetical protein
MTALRDIAKNGRKVSGHQPWPRVVVGKDVWRSAIEHIAAGRATLLGL